MDTTPIRWVKSPNQDAAGFTRMDEALSSAPPDLSDRFCEKPFDYAEIHSSGRLFLCCPSWLPASPGSTAEQEIRDVFNSPIAQDIRRSILDGSFSYCHKVLCPLIQARTLPRKANLISSRHRGIVEDGMVSGLEPIAFNLCYDDSCNLSCPSCRTGKISIVHGPEYEARKSIQDKVIRFVFGTPHERHVSVTITGSGDPFGSKLFRELLFALDGKQYPNVKIVLHTNGVALTPAVWNKLRRIHGNIAKIMVSVDAGNEVDYRITRRGGNWRLLMNNLEWLGHQRRQGAVYWLTLNLIVQRDNFRGIPDYVRIGKRMGADRCTVALLTDWGTWAMEEFRARAIWRVDHPLFHKFLDVMADPILGDADVDLGNVMPYRQEALVRRARRIGQTEDRIQLGIEFERRYPSVPPTDDPAERSRNLRGRYARSLAFAFFYLGADVLSERSRKNHDSEAFCRNSRLQVEMLRHLFLHAPGPPEPLLTGMPRKYWVFYAYLRTELVRILTDEPDLRASCQALAARLAGDLNELCDRAEATRLLGVVPRLLAYEPGADEVEALCDELFVEVLGQEYRQTMGGMWEEIGRLQRQFLLEHGLKRESYLLDVGCGCLRGGVKIIPCLERSHYYGVDANQEWLDAAKLELLRCNLSAKSPVLVQTATFDFEPLQRTFDFVLAHALFPHLSRKDIVRCLAGVERALAPGGQFFATFFEDAGDGTAASITHQAVDGEVVTYADREPFHQRLEWFVQICAGTRLTVEYIGDWNHPRSQKMLVFAQR